jgi:hypothetical protein
MLAPAYCAIYLLGRLIPREFPLVHIYVCPLEMSALPVHTLTSARQKQSISTCWSGLAWLYCLKNHQSVDTWEPAEGVQVHEANIARGQNQRERPRSQWMRLLCGWKRRLGLIRRWTEELSLKIFCEALSSVVVKTLCYKPEGHGFETRWDEWIFFNLRNPSGRTIPWGLLSLWQNWVT